MAIHIAENVLCSEGAEIRLNNGKISGLDTSGTVNPGDAASKAYVDAVAQGLDIKNSVKAATISNITLSGEQTIDGVSCVAGDRVLVKNQTDQIENGIYIVSTGSWSRSSDMAVGSDASGAFTFVENGGTVNGNTGWVCNSSPAIVGTNDLVFTQFSGAGTYTAGSGLILTGSEFSIGKGDGIKINADSIEIDLSAVSGLGFSGTSPNRTLELSDSVAGNGLTISDKILSVGAGNGIQVNTDDISIKLKNISGLELDANGLSIADTLAGDGLQISDKILSVKLKTNSGLLLDNNGLSVDGSVVQFKSEKDTADGYAGLNSSSRVTKGIDTTDDIIIDLSTKGIVLKDNQGTPHYWRITITNDGRLVTTDLGTSKP